MLVRSYIELASALSFENLKAVAESVKCPVHQHHATVNVSLEGFDVNDVCCEQLRQVIHDALLEYKLMAQRKFLRDAL
jgi:hypothetical protein